MCSANACVAAAATLLDDFYLGGVIATQSLLWWLSVVPAPTWLWIASRRDFFLPMRWYGWTWNIGKMGGEAVSSVYQPRRSAVGLLCLLSRWFRYPRGASYSAFWNRERLQPCIALVLTKKQSAVFHVGLIAWPTARFPVSSTCVWLWLEFAGCGGFVTRGAVDLPGEGNQDFGSLLCCDPEGNLALQCCPCRLQRPNGETMWPVL